MASCFGCGKSLTSAAEKKRCRLLSSPRQRGVLDILISTASALCTEVDSSKVHTGHVCRLCLALLERYAKVKNQITSNLQSAMSILPKKSTVETQSLQSTSASLPSVASPLLQGSPSSSPALTAKIFYRSKPQSYYVTPTRRRICKPLIRESYHSFAENCLRKKASRTAIVDSLGKELQSEVAAICSDTYPSITRLKSKEVVKNFNHLYSTLQSELKTRAPTLLSLLKSSLKTKTPRKNTDAVISMIVSIMCKHRRPSACQVQRVISLILYTGHSSKQVFQRLQRLGLCLSHSNTIKLVHRLGADFDLPVKQWKKDAEQLFASIQVSVPTTLPAASRASPLHFSRSPSLSPHTTPPSLSPPMTPTRTPVPFTSTPVSEEEHSVMAFSLPDYSLDVDSECTMDGVSEYSISEYSMAMDDYATYSDCSSQSEGEQSVHSVPDTDRYCPVFSLSPPVPILLERLCQPVSANAGFKIVFDNLDTNVKPRHMNAESQTKSLHYVQAYAVKDRVDYSCLSDKRNGATNLYDILPSPSDYSLLKEHFAVHVARLMTEYLKFFKEDFKGLTKQHIGHKYSVQHATKSEVVPLGILFKNETKHEDMADILEEYKKYVPSSIVTLDEQIPKEDTTEDRVYITTLVGGDYLSAVRAREAQYIRGTAELRERQLNGMLPMAEDWHAKVCFMEVIWRRLYKTGSGMEKGTLYHIRNFVNRRNVTKTTKGNVNASEDFLEAVVVAYILAAVMHYLGMSSFDDKPLASIVPHDAWMKDIPERSEILHDISHHIVNEYVDLTTVYKDPEPPPPPTPTPPTPPTPSDGEPATSKQDPKIGGVCEHTREMLSLGLLYLDFKDAVREGDGDRVLLAWKYFFLLFKASGRKNYAIEAFTLLSQYHITLPPNLAEQLKWSRFINMHGLPGHCISCDLHMEHMNRLVKTSVEGLGPNKSEKAITRVGRAIGVVASAIETFDKELGVPVQSDKHSDKKKHEDVHTIVMLLLESGVLDLCSKKKFSSFPNLKSNLIKTIGEKKLKDWMVEKFSIINQPELGPVDVAANVDADEEAIASDVESTADEDISQ